MTIDQHDCRCETEDAPETPEPIDNAPGQSAIVYRAGTYASFFETMRASATRKPALSSWTTRSPEDFGVALLDLWAHVADVLTFYQERIANEAYLQTAAHRESVRRLAALVGYRPAEGVSADVDLAFVAEPGKRVSLAAGHRVQSVPPPGQKPQKFELSEPLEVSSMLNAIDAFPLPATSPSPWAAAGSSSVVLSPFEPPPEGIRPGQVLLLAKEGTGGFVEEKPVEALVRKRTEIQLAFAGPLQNALPASAKIWRFTRKYQLFGANLPATYVTYTAVSVAAGSAIYNSVATTIHNRAFSKLIGNTLYLDGQFDDLAPGQELLIVDNPLQPALVTRAQVSHVGPSEYVFDTGATATVTAVRLKAPVSLPSLNVRTAVVYALTGAAIERPQHIFGAEVSGAALLLPDASGLVPLLPGGKKIALDDASLDPVAAEVQQATTSGAPSGYVRLLLRQPLPRALARGSAVCFGNIGHATHGETIAAEPIGDGDASAAFQSFVLKGGPLTYVRDEAADGGARSTLEVRVSGMRWKEEPSLAGRAGDARVFVTSTDEKGRVHVGFGDGAMGARLASGTKNVVASYRKGVGRVGNVVAGVISTLITRPGGLKAVTNPWPAEGGADPEPEGETREKAPGGVRTLGRVVSLTDFEDAAREVRGVAKARATFSSGPDEDVKLVIAPDDGAVLTGALRQAVGEYLDARRDKSVGLSITGHRPVPLTLIADVTFDADAVDPVAAQASLLERVFRWLSFDARKLGEPIALSAVERFLLSAHGAVAVRVVALRGRAEPVRDAATDPLGLFAVAEDEVAFVERPDDVILDSPGGAGR